jgi:hypothetical protein
MGILERARDGGGKDERAGCGNSEVTYQKKCDEIPPNTFRNG